MPCPRDQVVLGSEVHGLFFGSLTRGYFSTHAEGHRALFIYKARKNHCKEKSHLFASANRRVKVKKWHQVFRLTRSEQAQMLISDSNSKEI
ncbi:hypothetical protein B566_EDAN016986 [Ephemera danica]|nr:hypothetical protein B566_EDAN016986 [Ephemera danica]